MTQESWNELQQQADGAEANAAGTLLLKVIANSAARFPPAQAADLAVDLLKVSSLALLHPLMCRMWSL